MLERPSQYSLVDEQTFIFSYLRIAALVYNCLVVNRDHRITVDLRNEAVKPEAASSSSPASPAEACQWASGS